MPADRLTVLDDAFLALDSPRAPLHVGWTIGVDGRPPSLAGLRRHLAARMDRVPRFRRRLVSTALAGGELRWEDDAGFDLANHVTAVAAAAPGDDETLRRLAGRLLSCALPLDRPLWRVYLIGGLDHGFAIVGQAHHALIDGIAAIEVAALLFDAEPNPRPDPPSTWRPRRTGAAEAALALTRDRVRAGAGQGAALARAGRRTAGRTRDVVRLATQPPRRIDAPADATRTVTALSDLVRPASGTPLTGPSQPTRELGLAALELDAVRRAAKDAGATVNDVLLASVAHALGHALQRRDENPVPLKAMVPVNVRVGAASELGNALSFVFVDLPSDRADPRDALAEIITRMRTVKESDRAATLTSIVRVADLVPTAGRRAVAKALGAATRFDLTVSNVPGPEIPLYLLGRRVRAVFPAVPIWDGRGLTVGALSYCGAIHVCVYADLGIVPDAQDIAGDIVAAVEQLGPARGPTRMPPVRTGLPPAPGATPWGRRARARRATPAGRTRG